jgi:CBS domain-containing protein
MKVREAMAKTVTSAKKTDKVGDVAKQMKSEDAGFIPVVDGELLIGVITDRDIVINCIAEGHDPRGGRWRARRSVGCPSWRTVAWLAS